MKKALAPEWPGIRASKKLRRSSPAEPLCTIFNSVRMVSDSRLTHVITISESAREIFHHFSHRFGRCVRLPLRPAAPVPLRFSYTIIIHIGALDLRSKVSTVLSDGVL